jgi:hypothetical protein
METEQCKYVSFSWACELIPAGLYTNQGESRTHVSDHTADARPQLPPQFLWPKEAMKSHGGACF